jgi:hypothetical protein
MPLAGFEPTIPVFKRAKTFHALDLAATVTGDTILLKATKYCTDFCVTTESGTFISIVQLFQD